jgi:aconitate hydratase
VLAGNGGSLGTRRQDHRPSLVVNAATAARLPRHNSAERISTAPLSTEAARTVTLVKGPNIHSLPDFEPLPDSLELPILLKMADNVSTDEILPAGAKVLPYRSNIEKIADFAFERIDPPIPSARAQSSGADTQ